MLCCFGLFLGFAVGSMLGGPWTIIGPIAGFGLGLMIDMKLLRNRHQGHSHWGCCGGVTHLLERDEEKARDPVCGMQVGVKGAKYKAEVNGRTYYFCSRKCLEEFSKDPNKYQ